jgi:hypothetical protein
MSDLEPHKLSCGLSQALLAPFRPAIFEIRDGDIPIVFQHGHDPIATAGGWAILSAHRLARRHAVGF